MDATDSLTAMKCPVDGAPCGVAAAVVAHLDKPGVVTAETIWTSLLGALVKGVCQRCRLGIRSVDLLDGVRLGHHSRELLVAMAADPRHRVQVAFEGQTKTETESRGAALRRLERAGLIYRTKDFTGGCGRLRQFAGLTELGAAAVAVLATEFARTKRIRWSRWRQPIADHLRLPDKDLLLITVRRLRTQGFIVEAAERPVVVALHAAAAKAARALAPDGLRDADMQPPGTILDLLAGETANAVAPGDVRPPPVIVPVPVALEPEPMPQLF